MANPDVAERLVPLIECGVVATTASLHAAALYSARDANEYKRLRNDRRLAYEYPPTVDEHWQADLSWPARADIDRWVCTICEQRCSPLPTTGRSCITTPTSKRQQRY